MKPFLLRLLLPFGLSLSVGATSAVPPSPPAQAITHQAFRAVFGGVTSQGEVTFPAGASGPLPTVLLIHGATPLDKNATIAVGPEVRSQIFRQLADTLSAQGFAVVRYDKRGLNDPAVYAAATLQDFLADARTALHAAEHSPQVDPQRLFVYGWSEGSGVAAQLALTEPGVRGLIVQGPVAHSYAQTLASQFERVTLPYLRGYAPEGHVGVPELLRAYAGPGGALARSNLFFFWDPRSTPEKPVLREQMDLDHDGRIDLRREALPFVQVAYRDPRFLGPYAPGKALPGLIEMAPRLKLPVLILQGQQDANVAAQDAQDLDSALSRAGNTDHTLKLYPGLGHSLGRADSVTNDDFRPMDARPLKDVAAWLLAHQH